MRKKDIVETWFPPAAGLVIGVWLTRVIEFIMEHCK